jgi:hypothetical protein
VCGESEGLEKLRLGSLAIFVREVRRILCAPEKIVIVPYRRDLALAGAHVHEQRVEIRIAQQPVVLDLQLLSQFGRALRFVSGRQVNVVTEQQQYVRLVAENVVPDFRADLFAVIAAGGKRDTDDSLPVRRSDPDRTRIR